MKLTPKGQKKTGITKFFIALGIAASVGLAAQGKSPSRMPTFEYRLIDGSIIKSADLKGKVAVIDFWGTWCGPCIQEIPEYNRLYAEKKNSGFVLLGLAVDSGTEEQVRTAAKRLSIGYLIAAPKLAELDVFGDLGVIPPTWVIDREGKVAMVFLGQSPGKQRLLRETIDRLLQH